MAFNPYSYKTQKLNEHETMLQDLSIVLSTPAGKNFVKYLLKSFGVAELPEIAMPSNLRDEYVGFLRAGQSLFEIVSQADTMAAGLILAQIQKEKMDVQMDENSNGRS